MYPPDIECIIPAHPVLELDRPIADKGAQYSDKESRFIGDIPSCGSNRSKASHRTCEQAHKRWTLVRPEPFNTHPGDSTDRGSKICIDEGKCGNPVHIQFTARIEAIPTEPEQCSSNGNQRKVIGSVMLDPSFTDINNRSQRCKTGSGVHHNTPCKIKDTPFCKQPVAPDHVCKRIINKYLPERQKDKKRLERNSVGKGSCDECRCNNRKHHLICDEHNFREAFFL